MTNATKCPTDLTTKKGYLDLCQRCSAINFDDLLNEATFQDIGMPRDWDFGSCSLCKFLFSRTSGLMEDHYVLVQRTALSNAFGGTFSGICLKNLNKDTHYISGAIFLPQCSTYGTLRFLKADSIDFDILREWLQTCQKMHTKTCNLQERALAVPLLQVIDCSTRRIVPAIGKEYVTLSYVWGQDQVVIRDKIQQLPPKLPHTIEDAITVTQKLGFKYLWIDRYCIDQEDKQQAYAQVQQMDTIYQNSVLTIIAAAGSNPAYGLPGVSSRHRQPQIWGKVGKHTFFYEDPVMADAYNAINVSSWSKRAWTYQEALLSRRRFVFTDYQVYFECNGMYCYEGIDCRLDLLHTTDGQQYSRKYVTVYIENFYHVQRMNVFPLQGVDAEPADLWRCIFEYSRRSLTYRSDKLNAFLGILRNYETLYSMRHVWGVPIFPPWILSNSVDAQKVSKRHGMKGFIVGLCWVSQMRNVSCSESSLRQKTLPSWSWTGYEHGSTYEFEPTLMDEKSETEVEISIELGNGDVLNWAQYHQRYDEINKPSQLSTFIHISTWTLPIQVNHQNNSYHSVRVSADLKDGNVLSWLFLNVTHAPSFDGIFTGIVLDVSEFDRDPFLIFACQVENRMERVGGGWLMKDLMNLSSPDHQISDAEEAMEKVFEIYGKKWWKKVGIYQTIRLG